MVVSGGDISMMTEAEFGALVDECRADFWRAVEQRAARFAGGLDQGVPVSIAPMVFIVVVEAGFLVGTLLIWRWFRRAWAQTPAVAA